LATHINETYGMTTIIRKTFDTEIGWL